MAVGGYLYNYYFGMADQRMEGGNTRKAEEKQGNKR